MTLIRPRERAVVRAIAALVDCNPFLPERVDLERRALGSAFLPATAVWHAEGDAAASNPNADRLRALVERVAEDLHTRLAAGVRASAEELATYRRVVFYWLFQRYEDDWYGLIEGIVAGRVAGPDAATALAHRVETWVSAHLGPNYSWPGNMRELEQCVRNILVRGEYTPPVPPIEAVRIASSPSTDDADAAAASTARADPFLSAVQGSTLTGEEVLQAYCAQVHLRAGSYEEAARRLDLDPRTVRAKVRAWSKRPRADGAD